MQVGSLTITSKSSNSVNKDLDNNKFPLALELVSNFWKQQAKQDLSRGLVFEAINKAVLDKGNHSINPNKPILGLYLGDSQGRYANSLGYGLAV